MAESVPFPVTWITGASTGIGRALALRLAAEGCTVAASARSVAELDSLAQEASPLPGRIVAVPLDVTDPADIEQAYARITGELGVPDLCVLNAGTYIPVNAKRLKAADFETQFNLNVMGTVRVLEAVIPGMVSRKSGRIAVVGSVSGYRGLRTASAYGATKAALINMCEALRMELGDHGIAVQIVNPGFIKTPLTDKNTFPMPFLMPVDKAVEQFYRGLLTSRFEITFPKRFTWMLKTLRLLPYAIYLPLMNRTTKAD
ncbi:MAG: SDR family NAD(P)-dependent oxidoreductase [Proteobacteria bacterium]|nr:SDR family NAD(P)-dependent oxidoreductase [Pseudomonadota bacterium]